MPCIQSTLVLKHPGDKPCDKRRYHTVWATAALALALGLSGMCLVTVRSGGLPKGMRLGLFA